MGKSSGKGLAVTGLIIGIIGALLGTYSFFTIYTNTASNVRRSWYDSTETNFVLAGTGIYNTIPDLSITVIVNPGENLYISFQANTYMDSGASEISFFACIDGFTNTKSYVSFARSYIVGVGEFHTLTLQYVNYTLSQGTHVITIIGTSDDIGANSQVYKNSNLFVQTFI